jgi:hypothetical protein
MNTEYISQKIFELKSNLRTLPTKISEKIACEIAFHLPKKVVYFATIRSCAYGTTGEYGDTIVPEVTAMEVLHRWESV